eukprot:CAMPEP_0195284834 /NCGR_PEP_ID=MMETSP0707-20130614/2894_1 /TAXON_ID=33640 /ORGANISM="Asterionellopsis glacialis, Strain CCMP134" /LENGTH=492 /DNA_ID=CAMNT_0040344235 /DNA_START=924 /DNA_END=2402 /DNA_ORIENTATION=-
MSNAYQNSFQQPMFAPAQGNQQLGDDIDLNEIFADYFISEFDDPLNAYTSSMANYSGAAAAMALAQKQQQVVAAATTTPMSAPLAAPPSTSTLPTGGIKTAWHTGAATQPANASLAQQQQPQQQQQQQQQQLQTQLPPPKRVKTEGESQGSTGGGLSGRLGFSMVGGQLAMPGGEQQQQAAAAPAPTTSGNVQLPVGVGIRLGGVGGVAPSTAQNGTARPVVGGAPQPGQYNMGWGGFPGQQVGQGGGGMSEQAIAERRQRNREHAKRSRVRKKFMLESLQEQVRQLQKENVNLRMIVQQKIPQHAQNIISECCSKSPLFTETGEENPSTGANPAQTETELVKSDFSLISSLTSGQQNFVLSDPRLPDNPIVYASEGFYELTGYSREQVLGRNCRFLQGPGTDQRSVDIIRTAIANGSDATVCLLNYKADGTPFWNQFFVAALRDSDNCIVNYVGVQCEVEPEAGANALEDKVNAVLPLQNKGEGSGDEETK